MFNIYAKQIAYFFYSLFKSYTYVQSTPFLFQTPTEENIFVHLKKLVHVCVKKKKKKCHSF